MSSDTNDNEINRRLFLKILGWGSFFITLVISIIGTVRFLFPRVLFEEPSIFKVGFPDEFRTGEESGNVRGPRIYEEWKQEQAVWIVKEENRMYAMHARCTHLGCTPNWFAAEGIFKCPCHGSQFKGSGENFAGPAPRPFDRCAVFIDDNGRICVDKSRTYSFKDFNKKGAYLEI
ncbi:MAG: ubiquinol-cytochrome c reductase iron-sulfur subunit [Nitrospirota bacterium]